MITDIITKAPFWVWPLLAYLIFIGVKSNKPQSLPLKVIKKLMIIPVIFLLWAVYSIVQANQMPHSIFMLAGLIAGTGVGYLLTRHHAIRFDTVNNRIEILGGWMTLILALSIFCTKFILGALHAMHPEMNGTLLIIVLQCIATFLSGIFVGRGIRYWQKYRHAMQVEKQQSS